MNQIDPKLVAANSEGVSIRDYDPEWPREFLRERDNLESLLPPGLIKRVEHFGSTAVPNLAAKPIIDMLIEISDLETAVEMAVPTLTNLGYEYFWRPTFGSADGNPHYAWFIKRNSAGQRSHHIHMVEKSFPHWIRLKFRDYLVANPNAAQEYATLKRELASLHPNDRTAHTAGKSKFIAKIMKLAG